jgi:hypothetical protein
MTVCAGLAAGGFFFACGAPTAAETMPSANAVLTNRMRPFTITPSSDPTVNAS